MATPSSSRDDDQPRDIDQEAEAEAASLINPPHPGPIPAVLRDQPARPAAPSNADAGVAGMARAWAVALDFVFSILAGAGLGWGFDRWRGTTPWGLLVGLGLGFVIAFWRIVRTTQAQERQDAAGKRR